MLFILSSRKRNWRNWGVVEIVHRIFLAEYLYGIRLAELDNARRLMYGVDLQIHGARAGNHTRCAVRPGPLHLEDIRTLPLIYTGKPAS